MDFDTSGAVVRLMHIMTKARVITADAASFGRIIERLRRAQGLTIVGLARRTGFNKNHLRLLEKGQNMPSLSMLFALAEVLRVDAADMVREVEAARREQKRQRAATMLAAGGFAVPKPNGPDEQQPQTV